jgi:hypothetical protein
MSDLRYNHAFDGLYIRRDGVVIRTNQNEDRLFLGKSHPDLN